MQYAPPSFVRALRFTALAAALACTAAHADEYSDVNQLLRAGKTAEAAAKADQYLASKPRDPQMRFLKGVIQSESGRQAEAINTFSKLTEDFPELPEPYNNLAVLYAGQSQFDKARAALEMAIRTNPSYATAHENLGDVYAKLASQAYSKALQLDGSNTAVQPKLALIRDLFAPGKGSKAVAVAKAPATPAPAAPVTTAPVSSGTPAAAPLNTPAETSAPAAAAGDADADVEAAVRAWAAAWAAKDMAGYLAAYGKDFTPPGGQSRKAWEEERRQRIVGKSTITVKIDKLAISSKGNTATARFNQEYKADALAIAGRKTLSLVKAGDRWVIVKEVSGG
ncbi:MAG TPA: tetratricopeptide repeat protein [Burkholderiaceae bacterium]